MHDTALSNAQLFVNSYLNDSQELAVYDIGSQNVNGSLSDLMPPGAKYTGVDFVKGSGVDVILDDPYQLPFSDSSADVILSSSVFEHSEFFWLLFLEIIRVLKPGGVFYLNVPSNGLFHRYPVDCWRFYPDSGKALERWGQRNKQDVLLLESYVGQQGADGWNDFVAVFLKGKKFISKYPHRIQNKDNNYYNGYVYPSFDGSFQCFSDKPEDQLKLESAMVNYARLKNDTTRVASEIKQQVDSVELGSIGVEAYNLELPSLNDVFDKHQLGSVIKVAGWCLAIPGVSVTLAIRVDSVTYCYPLNVQRPDVINAKLLEESQGHERLLCGFSYEFQVLSNLQIGFEIDYEIHWIKDLILK